MQAPGVIGRGQNSGYMVHSAIREDQEYAVKVSIETGQAIGTLRADALRFLPVLVTHSTVSIHKHTYVAYV